MFKVWLCFALVNALAYVSALHNFLPSEVVKKNVYTNFVPPSAERFFAPSAAAVAASVPSTKAAVAPLLPASANSPYLAPYASPYAYQAQYSPYAFKQYPYYPGVFYPPPQQFVYPGAVGPSPVVFVPRYPAPAESGSEQGGSSGGSGGWGSYFPSNWQSWGSNWGSYFPTWPGSGSTSESAEGGTPVTPAEGASSQGAAAPATSGSTNRGKPEKLESAEPAPTLAPAPAPSQDSVKLDADKNSVTVELPEQQYVLLGQPQFFGHFAAFPADRDPTSLNGAAKGAVSSFLFYKDQTQQVAPQRLDDLSNVPGSASLAYQRFLLLSKQRSEDGPKPANKSQISSSTPSSLHSAQNEISQSNSNSTTNATAAAAATADAASVETSPAKASEDGLATQTQAQTQAQVTGEIAQVTPNAVAYAGIGGVAGAAPVGTAYIANSGLASSAPRATAIAGTSNQSPDFAVVPAKAKTISVARYTPQRKYHIDTVPSSSIIR